MTFPRIRQPGSWLLNSVWSPAEAEAFDDHQSKAIDGYNGGTYAPRARLVIGGQGVDFTGGSGADPNGPLTSTAPPGSGASGLVASGDGAGNGVKATGGAGGATGVVGTGTTTFAGVGGTGGASGGTGVVGAGGGTTGVGVQAFGAFGGNGDGVQGTGSGTGRGAFFTGGATGAGVHAQGGASGNGVTAFGGGTTGYGGLFTGGGTNSPGVGAFGGGTNGLGVLAQGAGSGAGVSATGGATGAGVVATGGASGAAGIVATGTGSSAGGLFNSPGGGADSIVGHAGPLHIDTNIGATSTGPGSNRVWGQSIAKSWGYGVWSGGVLATNGAGINYSAAINGGDSKQIDVTFITHMADEKYDVNVDFDGGSAGAYFLPRTLSKSASGFSFRVVGIAASVGPPGSVLPEVDFGSAPDGSYFSFSVHATQT